MAKSNKPEIMTRLDKHNTHDDCIKIRARVKTAGGISVYFDYFNKGKRELKYLDKKLHFDGTPAMLQSDKDKLKIIVTMRDQLQNDLLKNETGFTLSDDKDKDFTPYFEHLAQGKDHNWLTCIKHFKKFTKGARISFANINHSFCSKFAEYLQSQVGANTAIMFFQKFKSTLTIAVKEDIISKNPSLNVSMKRADTKKEFLNIDEIKKLTTAPKPNPDSCNAFLFSCFTGVRISDLRALTFDQIQDGYLIFKQQKTGNNERMKLNQTALNIIKMQSEFRRNDHVFNLMILTTIERHLKIWTTTAGIDKHITFHCGRHTFATMALTNDIDLYTVSKLLGHRSIASTQIYAKLIDKKKDEAVDKLPEIDM